MESLKEKAKALLQQCEVVTLTSINKERVSPAGSLE